MIIRHLKVVVFMHSIQIKLECQHMSASPFTYCINKWEQMKDELLQRSIFTHLCLSSFFSFSLSPLCSLSSHLRSLIHLCSLRLSFLSPQPSVYPIWLSHLSWELSQGAKLLIQFLFNIMTLRSVFTILLLAEQSKRRKKTWRTKKNPVWISPNKLSLDG